jgi:hypothetical protein
MCVHDSQTHSTELFKNYLKVSFAINMNCLLWEDKLSLITFIAPNPTTVLCIGREKLNYVGITQNRRLPFQPL